MRKMMGWGGAIIAAMFLHACGCAADSPAAALTLEDERCAKLGLGPPMAYVTFQDEDGCWHASGECSNFGVVNIWDPPPFVPL